MSLVNKSVKKAKRIVKNYNNRWKPPFKKVSIKSSVDENIQHAYHYAPTKNEPRPLIVSLHSWASTYQKPDPVISKNAVENGWNYIHPDFRGINDNPKSVGSDLSMTDINDAIEYCTKNGNVDLDNIFIVGGSGGAYATLCFYPSTKYKINTYIAWSPITDLIAWHDQSIIRNARYVNDIMTATESAKELDAKKARKRSPLYRDFPKTSSKFYLFSGYNDGATQGPVPLTHTLDFYNKIAIKNGASEIDIFSKDEYIKLSIREMLPTDKKIDGKSVICSKEFQNINATIFDGGHDHLANHSVKLIKDNIK